MSTTVPPARSLRGRFLDLHPDKLRGGYYTSADLCAWLVSWVVRSPVDRVLEPSCGDGAFIGAVVDRLDRLGASAESIDKQVVGVEIIETEAAKARSLVSEKLHLPKPSSIEQSDFFEWWSAPGRGDFDAIVGNPPFIRYQTFPEPHRARAMSIMVELGLRPNKLTNIWVPFVAAAAAALVPGGRLALVIPAELLQVGYAAQLRHFLVEHFTDVHVVTCNELLFEDAEQEVVLLLASGAHQLGAGEACGVSVSQMASRHELMSITAEEVIRSTPPKVVQHADEKWLKYFLAQKEIDLLRDLRSSGAAATLDRFASVDVGVVTGKNEFFVVTSEQVEEWDLKSFVMPLAARAAHIPGSRFSKADWASLAMTERVWLLQLGDRERSLVSPKTLAYVEAGEKLGHHLGYKCSIRTPWYAVPSVWVPDAFLFRQIHDFPRIVVNDAQATCTDTIHRVRVADSVDVEVLASMCFTSLTAASAEIEGRSYGGGVLELEPTEAERLLVPGTLLQGLPLDEIDALIRAGKLHQVIEKNDQIVLRQGLGLSAAEVKLLQSAWNTMRGRRQGRRRMRKASVRGTL